MRYLYLVPIALIVVMLFGCSGKTTVHEEMINTSSDDKTEPTGQQLSDDIQDAADEEKANQDEEAKKEEEKPEKRPAPGQGRLGGSDRDKDKQDPFSDTGSSKKKGHSKEERQRYIDSNMKYPGSEEIDGFGLPASNTNTNVTLLSNDKPDQVAMWYQTQFAGKTSVNRQGDKLNPEYHISVNDQEKGYKSNIIISKSGGQGQTRIILSVSDA